MSQFCIENRFYHYPSAIRPYIIMFYEWKRDWSHAKPDKILFNGSILCRGYQGNTQNRSIWENYEILLYGEYEPIMCDQGTRNYQSEHQFTESCNSELSRTFNNRSYAFYDICHWSRECISQYRISDAHRDCKVTGEDEDRRYKPDTNLCRRERFQCFDQRSCLVAQDVGDDASYCSNGADEIYLGTNRKMKDIRCERNDKTGCQVLRYYIGNSSLLINVILSDTDEKSVTTVSTSSAPHLPFRSYCDSFWHLKKGSDESSLFCRQWVCNQMEFQCHTGQCIEVEWVGDGHWDCSDASDEETRWRLGNDMAHNFLMDRIEVLARRKTSWEEHHLNGIRPFQTICNISTEYSCLLANVSNPLDIDKNRPCILLSQIGDGIAHCHGGLDEKNTFENCAGSMLGYGQRCEAGCSNYPTACSICMNDPICFLKSKNESFCSGPKDVLCLNGECQPNARCDKKKDCPVGEDEFWCYYGLSTEEQTFYRPYKEKYYKKIHPIRWKKFPPLLARDENIIQTDVSPNSDIQQSSFYAHSYWCNRGIAVISTFNQTIRCFCPPVYYGSKCEYYSDRLTVFTHLDLSDWPQTRYLPSVFRIKANLVFDGQIIDHCQFFVQPIVEKRERTKQRFYLLYSRSKTMLKHKQERYFNRTDIVNNYPYTVHLDLYAARNDTRMIELGSWRHLIHFDFMPSFRLATVMKFPSWFGNFPLNPCVNNTCNGNSTCHPIFNQNNSYYCSCNNGYYGAICAHFEHKCDDYCSPNSICKPNDQGVLSNTNNPFCLCSAIEFGPRCNLRHDQCQTNPCQFNGTCILSLDRSGELQPFRCQCSKLHFGDRCEFQTYPVHIRLNISSINVRASVVQFYDTHNKTLALLIQQQQLFNGLPSTIYYEHGRPRAPALAILKTYKIEQTEYLIIYVRPDTDKVNLTSTPALCPHALTLLSENQQSEMIPSHYKYHQICRNNLTQHFCFYDSVYFCICQEDHYRVECFGHNINLDHCDICLFGGKCLKGNLEDPNDFICLCPTCHQGRLCEFSIKAFEFTVDALLVNESSFIQITYIVLTSILFSIGLFNNLCSFLTFQRAQSRKLAVDHYLLVVVILNQFALLFLLLKFVHIHLSTFAAVTSLSCKTINYLLSIFTRSTYWFTTWITIYRLLLSIFPMLMTINNPHQMISSSIVTLIILFAMHCHELIFYTTVQQPGLSKTILCVLNFEKSLASTYSRVNTLFHYFAPFFIQVLVITLLTLQVARSRFNATGRHTIMELFKKKLLSHKELYVIPITIITSVLPHAIVSFSLACVDINVWQKHILLTAFLLSYAPHILGFVLYVLPSHGGEK